MGSFGDASVPVPDSLSLAGISSALPAGPWLSSAKLARLRASVSRCAPRARRSRGTTRWHWWRPACGAAASPRPTGAPSAFLPALLPGCAPRRDSLAPVAGRFSPTLLRRRVLGHRVGVADAAVVIALDVFRQMLFDVAPLVDLAALHFGTLTKHALDGSTQCFGSVDHEQVAPFRAQSARHQVFQQRLHHRGVFRRALPHSQHVFLAAAGDAQRHHQHLLAEMNPVDQNRHQIEIAKFLLTQFLQLRRTGGYELPAHAGFFNPVAVHHALDGPAIVPRSQSRNDAFAHRALPPSVVLQPRVTVQFHFLSFPRAHSRTLHRHFPPAEHYVSRLTPPAHRPRLGIRPVRRSHPPRHLVFQNRADDAQPGTPRHPTERKTDTKTDTFS